MTTPVRAAGFVLVASASIGCGNGITEQPGIMVGGGAQGGSASSLGMGGSTSVVGAAGTAGAGGGAGMSALPDAGVAGGSGGASAFTYPPGCPVPAPIAAKAGQQIAIQSVNFTNSEIILRNVSTRPVKIVGTRAGWQWCNFPAYWDVADADVTLQPDQTYKFIAIYNTSGPRPFFAEQGELGIYSVSGSFDEPDLILTFVSWGTGVLGGREYVATMGDVWTYNNHVVVENGDGFIATGNVKVATGFTAAPARCLVAPDNPPLVAETL